MRQHRHRHSRDARTMIQWALVLLMGWGLCGCIDSSTKTYKAHKGVLDLRKWDLSQQKIIRLHGAWEVFWDQALSPTALRGRRADRWFELPATWNKQKRPGKRAHPAHGVATFRLKILLPPAAVRLSGGLRVLSPEQRTASRLWALDEHGHPLGLPYTQGNIGHRTQHVPRYHRGFVYISRPRLRTLILVLQVSNYNHARGGPHKSLLLGTNAALESRQSTRRGWSLFFLGMVAFMGLYHLVLFLFHRNAYAALWFTLFCLTAFIRTAGVDGHLPALTDTAWGWRVTLKLEYFATFLGTPLLLLFYGAVLSQRITRWLLWPVVLASILFTIHGMLVTTTTMSANVVFFFPFIIAQFTYILVLSLRRYLDTKDPICILIWIGFAIGFAPTIHDMIVIRQGLTPAFLAQYSFLAMMLCQSIILALLNRRAFAHIEELSLDLTQKNQRLEQVDKLKDEFLANTSHELRTPLNGIIGLAESIRDGATGALPQDTKDNLTLIVHSGKRLSHLINDILDFSKLRHQEIQLAKKSVDLHAIVEVVLTLSQTLIGQKQLELRNSIPPEIPHVWGDEDRLQQILYNLVGNAIKFTEDGHIDVCAQHQGPYVAITITDTGIGIPADRQAQIFRAFEQVDGSTERIYGGTGLGLAISKHLVELHAGTLSVSSTPAQGSAFTFTVLATIDDKEPPLPKKKPSSTSPGTALSMGDSQQETPERQTQSPKTPERTTQPPYEPHTKNPDNPLQEAKEPVPTAPQARSLLTDNNSKPQAIRIMAVDDEPINLQVLQNYLSLEHFQVQKVTRGTEMLTLLETSPRPDLILLDVMMPVLSGYDACRALRQRFTPYELPVLMLTAKNQPADIVQGFLCGANDYITKPFTREVLVARIRTHLQLARLTLDLEQQVRQRTEELQKALGQIQEQHQELKHTQVQLVQSEKMASLGTLVAGIAHELNNPVNFAYGGAQNLERRLRDLRGFLLELAGDDADDDVVGLFEEKFAPLFDNLDSVINGAERISSVVRDLRTFSRLDEASQKHVHLCQGLEATISLVQANYADQIAFAYDFQADPTLLCFPAQLNQVFMHLALNACQAIQRRIQDAPDDYQPLLKVSTFFQHTDNTEASEETQEVGIRFVDNGCGMTEETQERMFEPFFTTKSVGEGAGLGLSIAYSIIEKHHGRLDVSSTPKQGSTFTLYLPIIRRQT